MNNNNFIKKMNKVFQCPKCSNTFDKKSRLPLTLPCGHVMCRECLSFDKSLNKVKCPIDNNICNASVKDLPPCQTILEHLPINNSSEFFCKDHQEKHIKYFCSTCSLSLCSKCIPNHISPHKVIPFYPVKTPFLEEIDKIMRNSVQKKAEIEAKEKSLTNQLKQTEIIKNEDNSFLIEIIDALITILNQLKEGLNNSNSARVSNQKDTIAKAIIKNAKDKEMINNLQVDMNKFIQMVNSNKKLIYEDIDKEKKNVIQIWETIVKCSVNDVILFKHQKEVTVRNNNDRSLLYRKLKKKFDIFMQIINKCEGTNSEISNLLLQSQNSQQTSNNSTRDLTRKSLQKQNMYSSTKNVSKISKALNINNKHKCEEINQRHLLYTDNP